MVHALRLSRSHRQDKEQRSSSLAASLCPLFHPRVFNPIHFLSLSLFLSLHSSHSSPPVPLSLSLARFFLIYRPRQLYTRRPLPFISRNNSILVYVSPLLARCLARMYPPSRATSYLTPSLAFGARASIQRRVPRLPLLYTCH